MDWLKGKHVKLRAVEPEDLKNLYRWENDSTLWNVSDTITPFSKYILKSYIEQAPRDIYQNKQLRLVIERIEGSKPESVGMVDLFDYDPYHARAAVGIYIDEDFKRQGFGSDAIRVLKKYAFEYLHIEMLHCFVGVDNPGSIAFFKENGFIVCGEIKNWLKGVDGYIDSLMLQCLNPKS